MSFPGEHASLSARSGNDPFERVETYGPMAAREEACGPIELRRYVKGDGRALILYTRGSPTQDGPMQDRSSCE